MFHMLRWARVEIAEFCRCTYVYELTRFLSRRFTLYPSILSNLISYSDYMQTVSFFGAPTTLSYAVGCAALRLRP